MKRKVNTMPVNIKSQWGTSLTVLNRHIERLFRESKPYDFISGWEIVVYSPLHISIEVVLKYKYISDEDWYMEILEDILNGSSEELSKAMEEVGIKGWDSPLLDLLPLYCTYGDSEEVA